METIKINKKQPIFISKELIIDSLYEYEDYLKINVKNTEEKWYHYAKSGDTLTLRRVIYDENNNERTLTQSLCILDISEKDDNTITITTEQPPIRNVNVEDVKVFSGNVRTNITNSQDAIKEAEKMRYVISFDRPTWVMPQDLAAVPTFRAFGKNHNGTIVYANSGFTIPLYSDPFPATSADTYEASYIDICGEEVKLLKYSYAPTKILRDSILIGDDLDMETAESLFSFEFEYNPFYYRGETDKSGYTLCHLWTNLDPWWTKFDDEINGKSINRVIKINSGHSRTSLSRNTAYWTINTTLLEDTDYINLGTEDLFSETYANNIIDSNIPEVLDMERLKYSPVNDLGLPLTSITLDFHFRKRAINTEKTKSANTKSTRENIYRDGWYVENDSYFWNGMSSASTKNDVDNFITSSGSVSDVIGYLNFNDDDIFYRKSKVSKTFVRLSFYTSTDPIEQKLLFYSTSFLDTTLLYGKYIKQYAYMESEGLEGYHEDMVSGKTTPITNVVFCRDNSISGVLSSEIILTNEYDRTKSSEGFNLYLFADDVDIKDVDENGEEKECRTIYMKVEFNHAGNGKTIPMVSHKKIKDLKVENFFDSLYIPIQISYLNGRYVYKIDSEYGQLENNGKNMRLMLFEPKLNRENEMSMQ